MCVYGGGGGRGGGGVIKSCCLSEGRGRGFDEKYL